MEIALREKRSGKQHFYALLIVAHSLADVECNNSRHLTAPYLCLANPLVGLLIRAIVALISGERVSKYLISIL